MSFAIAIIKDSFNSLDLHIVFIFLELSLRYFENRMRQCFSTSDEQNNV